jgi:hypothetical protein
MARAFPRSFHGLAVASGEGRGTMFRRHPASSSRGVPLLYWTLLRQALLYTASRKTKISLPRKILALFKESVIVGAPSLIREPIIILIRHDRYRLHHFFRDRKKET